MRHLLYLLLLLWLPTAAQQRTELHSGWVASPIGQVTATGEVLSRPSYALAGWRPAVVPGTVLTTQLANGQIPDPFYGMNNQRIPDVYRTGRAYYTYWFVKDFTERPARGAEQVWLHLRGVNYSCEVYVNGHRLNERTHYGMFLRQRYNVTPWLAPDGRNRLAVLVHPPDPVGNPNGGQGGDGTIARNVASQYTAGWDWIRPVRDRNTGIWDQVTVERTGPVDLLNPHLVPRVPGRRWATGPQAPARLEVSAELQNPTNRPVAGTLEYTVDGQTLRQAVQVPARATRLVRLPAATIHQPRLWWPNGYGAQPLYPVQLRFRVAGGQVSDAEMVPVGLRDITTAWNARTRSREVRVNGQPIFVRGGNWILSDALLRLSAPRYDAEVRFHRDMRLNLLRVWGGALLERPEFYASCDKYGLLVLQDFWMSGDANGRWVDLAKQDDQWTRRRYPDDHRLFVASAADQIKLIRNHPSLAMWCGGNEITPPHDILAALADTLLPQLDGTRWLVPYSNADSLSFNPFGGNGDGPYGIQPIRRFWAERTYPFNSEVGSVGAGEIESLARFLPPANLAAVPRYRGVGAKPEEQVDSVWDYHTYIGYGAHLLPYGAPTDARDFGRKAQLVNYEQYRALIEGMTAHMWDWYTGTIIWKTQNPWTSLRGELYDHALDPNAGLYGLRAAGEPVHVMFNPVDSVIALANHGFQPVRDLMLVADAYDMAGHRTRLEQLVVEINPSLAKTYTSLRGDLRRLARAQGCFLHLQLLDLQQRPVSQNFYWLPDATGTYSGLQALAPAPLAVQVRPLAAGTLSVTLRNPAGSPVAFFNRLALVEARTGQRRLPTFYTDNYVSVLPGEERTIQLDYPPAPPGTPLAVTVEGWNVARQTVAVP